MTESYRRSGDDIPQDRPYDHGYGASQEARRERSGRSLRRPRSRRPGPSPRRDGGHGVAGRAAAARARRVTRGGAGRVRRPRRRPVRGRRSPGGARRDAGFGAGGPHVPGRGERRRLAADGLIAAAALATGLIGGGSAALLASAGSTGTSAASAAPPSRRAAAAASPAVAKAVSPAIVEINARRPAGESTGSGVVITGDGEIVTNNHVVSGADTVSRSTFSAGKPYTADVVGTDPDKDLALIKVRGRERPEDGHARRLRHGRGRRPGRRHRLARGPHRHGDQRHRLGAQPGRHGRRRTGRTSGQGQGGGGGWPFEFGGNQFNGDTGSSKTTYKAIQTDASLNPGNSGGALINMQRPDRRHQLRHVLAEFGSSEQLSGGQRGPRLRHPGQHRQGRPGRPARRQRQQRRLTAHPSPSTS